MARAEEAEEVPASAHRSSSTGDLLQLRHLQRLQPPPPPKRLPPLARTAPIRTTGGRIRPPGPRIRAPGRRSGRRRRPSSAELPRRSEEKGSRPATKRPAAAITASRAALPAASSGGGAAEWVRELDIPGEIYERKTYPFEFSTVEMPYESYNGTNVRLRYILKVTIGRNYVGSIVESRDFCVRNYSPVPTINNSIKMEVGIEDCLHIGFEYSKSKYHLKDVIIGKMYFLLVRIKIKIMELEIRRRESTGSGSNTYVETETLAKFELMDGAPVRGESIPVRLFLTPYEVTPTYRNINNKFSVKYYLNLVLVDEEDRRYFKQQEITMYCLLETPQSS